MRVGSSARALAVMVATGLLLIGCAYQPSIEASDAPGFFYGLLHGFLAPYALLAGLFSEIRVYAYPNSGWFYDFGFMLGLLPWAFSAMLRGELNASQ